MYAKKQTSQLPKHTLSNLNYLNTSFTGCCSTVSACWIKGKLSQSCRLFFCL